MLRIVSYPHPALRYESRPILEIDDAFRATVREMFSLMYAAKGIGLAANQVALPFQFFVVNLSADPEQPDEEEVYINPEIVKRHGSVEDEEGCLSLPGLYSKVRRAKKIRVRAYDIQGNLVERDVDDLLSRAIQHETDHLRGKLFIDTLDPLVLHGFSEKIRGYELEYRQGQTQGLIPANDELLRRLERLARPSPEGIFTEPGA